MEKWKLKSFLKIVILSSIGWIGALIAMSFMIEDIYKVKEMITATIYLAGGVCGAAILLFLGNKYLKRKNEVNTKSYFREIEDEYTPAIASFVIDYTIERNEVILATILDLHIKKYLKILKQDKELQIEVINKNKDKLYPHERYIIFCIEQNKLIDEFEFSRLIEKDCQDIDLVIEKNTKTRLVLTKVFIISFFTLIFMLLLPSLLVDLSIPITIDLSIPLIVNAALVIILLFILTIKREHNRTNEGEILATKFKALKNYLKEYTLLSERDINYLELSERYLPFALALGVANKLENDYMNYIEYDSLISKYIKGGKQ